jgi:hypothetical protein
VPVVLEEVQIQPMAKSFFRILTFNGISNSKIIRLNADGVLQILYNRFGSQCDSLCALAIQ